MAQSDVRARVQRWMAAHEGIITARDAGGLGLVPSTLQSMVESGFVDRVERGVFRSGAWPPRERQQLIALCRQHPRLLISHTTALRSWGFRGITDQRLHVLVPHSSTPTASDAVVHRCRRVDEIDAVEMADGVRLTSPPRSVFDAAALLSGDATNAAIEHLLAHHCTFGTLEDTFRRLYHPRRPGGPEIRRALASRPRWRSAMHSKAEARVLEAIAVAGLPTPVPQFAIRLRTGRDVHVDFGWPDVQVALEVDDPHWHDFLEGRRRDKRRDIETAAVGWLTCRLPTTERGAELDARLADVAWVLRSRGWRR